MSWIIAARRTAVAPAGGAFRRLSLHDLAAPVIRACLADAGLDPQDVDEVILANALGAGGNPARLAALAAGLPERVAGLSIDRQCAGGLDAAVLLAKSLVESGRRADRGCGRSGKLSPPPSPPPCHRPGRRSAGAL